MDYELCNILEEKRSKSRDEFPIRVMLNLVYSMEIFELKLMIDILSYDMKVIKWEKNNKCKVCGNNGG